MNLKKIKNDRVFLPWEQKIVKKFMESKIKFDTKFRTFSLKTNDGISINYKPDFFLKDYEINEKKIIIDTHEELIPDETIKYSTFMKTYFQAFYLIMIVQDNELRTWNTIDSSNRLFNDIWVIDDLKYLVEWIKKQNNIEKHSKQSIKCLHCTTTAVNVKQVDKLFGFRKKNNHPAIAHSVCRNCRRIQIKLGTTGLKKFIKQSEKELTSDIRRFCTGCDSYFKTNISHQSFCDDCNEKYWQ